MSRSAINEVIIVALTYLLGKEIDENIADKRKAPVVQYVPQPVRQIPNSLPPTSAYPGAKALPAHPNTTPQQPLHPQNLPSQPSQPSQTTVPGQTTVPAQPTTHTQAPASGLPETIYIGVEAHLGSKYHVELDLLERKYHPFGLAESQILGGFITKYKFISKNNSHYIDVNDLSRIKIISHMIEEEARKLYKYPVNEICIDISTPGYARTRNRWLRIYSRHPRLTYNKSDKVVCMNTNNVQLLESGDNMEVLSIFKLYSDINKLAEKATGQTTDHTTNPTTTKPHPPPPPNNPNQHSQRPTVHRERPAEIIEIQTDRDITNSTIKNSLESLYLKYKSAEQSVKIVNMRGTKYSFLTVKGENEIDPGDITNLRNLKLLADHSNSPTSQEVIRETIHIQTQHNTRTDIIDELNRLVTKYQPNRQASKVNDQSGFLYMFKTIRNNQTISPTDLQRIKMIKHVLDGGDQRFGARPTTSSPERAQSGNVPGRNTLIEDLFKALFSSQRRLNPNKP